MSTVFISLSSNWTLMLFGAVMKVSVSGWRLM
ncbi:hypothetical protein [Klebsiella phage PhiKpNIH-6]|uniref:Uncharacterized protein n=1 Tax=Klebsiella phage PhiKpNIH-6 TaxID=2689112 RepID=A0A6B9LRQ8_9CAUD|nr:hypothetical protein [Klebsiella phage PhiKpNIH-6]